MLECIRASDIATASWAEGFVIDPEGLADYMYKENVPSGLVSRLEALKGKTLVFLIDDGVSMIQWDCRNLNGSRCTRWGSVIERMSAMLRMLQYLRVNVEVHFTNRPAVHLPIQNGTHDWFDVCEELMWRSFSKPPIGAMNGVAALHLLLSKPLPNTLFYFFTDGNMPSVDAEEVLLGRDVGVPFTFLTCTQFDVPWMQELDGAALRNGQRSCISEVNIYWKESREIMRVQGTALPYNYGVYTLSQLVTSVTDIDVIDEPVKLTREELDRYMGYAVSDIEMQCYEMSFDLAQES